MSSRLIALIPAYNEAARVGNVVARTRPHVDEVVVIDDGSVDDTAVVAEKAGAKVFRHEQNRGKGGAIAPTRSSPYSWMPMASMTPRRSRSSWKRPGANTQTWS